MLDQLFVYGTLRKGIRNSRFHMLEQEAAEVTFVGRARIQGRLFHVGDYPGLVLSRDSGSWAHGEVYALAHPNDTLPRLDDYEGCGPSDPERHEFERVATEVTLESGAKGKAWVYVYKGSTANQREIPSGNYAEESF